MRILITGSNGLLGQKIIKQCIKVGVQFLATSTGPNRNSKCPNSNYMSLDITNKLEINQVFQAFYPTHIIHTAALTNVDYCEEHPEECYEVNVLGSQLLFEAAKQYHSHFQFLSTDFVFDGEKGDYSEEDEQNPLSVYAESKVETEKSLNNDSYQNWSIVRTIIVYGEGENLSRSNIVLWAKSATEKGNPLKIVDDQFRAPTWADDLAWSCLQIINKNERGVFHICGPETMSILDLVYRVADHFGYSKELITRLSSSNLNQVAKRPLKTGFDLTKATNKLGYAPKTIEQTLDLMTFK